MRIAEEIIHFIWRFRMFNPFHLCCQGAEEIEVIHPGNYNSDSGPDFLMAQLRINGRDWYGHVEVHVQASDWILHKHDQDPGYNAVILHVVWEGDENCYLSDGQLIPCLKLKDLVDQSLLNKIARLLHNTDWLPCSYGLSGLAEYQQIQVLNRMGIERLEQRHMELMDRLKLFRGDWERLCLSLMAAAFGMKVNKQAFQDLAQLLDLKLIQKVKSHPNQVQAIFFGQAGFLHSYKGKDPYVLKLVELYRYLKQTYKLEEMASFQWKFMRMRPPNFPTLKLAQLAAMYEKQGSWFSFIESTVDLQVLRAACESLEVPEFWETHFHLDKETKRHKTGMTDDFFENLCINGFVLLLFSYGKYIGSQQHIDKSISWLEGIKPELNAVSKRYRGYGISANNALESQALLHLRSNYCNPKRCLTCGIGMALIQRD